MATRGKWAAVVLVVIAAGLASCTTVTGGRAVDEEWFVEPGSGPIIRGRSVRIGQVSSDPAQLGRLWVTFVGGRAGDILAEPCATDYELEVDAASEPPVVTVWELRPTVAPQPEHRDGVAYACNDIGHTRRLDERAGAVTPREVVDGADGMVHQVVVVTARLAPDRLPDGWALADAPPPEPGGADTVRISDGSRMIWVRSSVHADPMAQLASMRTSEGLVEVTLREGTAGELSDSVAGSQLRFVEGSYLYQLSGDEAVESDLLIAVAEGMQWVD